MRSPCMLGRLHRSKWRNAWGKRRDEKGELGLERGKSRNAQVLLKDGLPINIEERKMLC